MANDTDTSSATPPVAIQPQPPKPAKIASLAELEKITRAAIPVVIKLGDAVFEVEVFRLTPEQEARVTAIFAAALPPVIEKEGDQPRYNFEDPDYLRNKRTNKEKGRALALYLGVPLFKQEQGDLTSEDAIHKFVQGRLTEDILAQLFAAVTGGPTANQYADFFSAPG